MSYLHYHSSQYQYLFLHLKYIKYQSKRIEGARAICFYAHGVGTLSRFWVFEISQWWCNAMKAAANAAKRTESNNLADKKVLHHLSQIVYDYTWLYIYTYIYYLIKKRRSDLVDFTFTYKHTTSFYFKFNVFSIFKMVKWGVSKFEGLKTLTLTRNFFSW